MERVETLLKKLQDQFAQNASPAQLLLTVQMLEAELQELEGGDNDIVTGNGITVTASHPSYVNNQENKTAEPETPPAEEKIIEVLQVDEAEIEAELEELRRNAEMMNKISAHNKPHIIPEHEEDDVPTLNKQYQQKQSEPQPEEKKPDLHDADASTPISINEKLKQSKIDLGETYT
ncbi:MAG TPA: hypothetical protein VKH37_02880, partial [Ferruginibacter sp.]|nr:hypothetical protein [Ferruginibacter sp.]